MAELTGPIQHKRDTSGEWAASTIPLRAGEIGIDTTVRRMKIGDGATLWPALKWQDVSAADLARFEAAAAALEGAVTPTDAAMALAVTTPGTATEQALHATIDSVGGTAIADDDSDTRAAGDAFFGSHRRSITRYGGVPGVDCSAQLSALFADLQPGDDIWFPAINGIPWTWSSTPVLTVPRVSIRGAGSLVDGRFKIGAGSSRFVCDGGMSGLSFYKPLDKTAYPVKGYADDSFFIEFDRVRGFPIHDCQFYGAAKPIHVKANSAAASHDNSMLHVSHNKFDECDAAVWIDLHASLVSAARGYEATADSNFLYNTVNKSYKYGYYSAGQDGGVIQGNTFFMINYTHGGPVNTSPRFAEKMQTIFVGESNWLHIKDNQCFEAGLEAIRVENARIYVITGNLIAWPGQREMRDGIYVQAASPTKAVGWASGTIADNPVSQYTKSAVTVVGDHVDLAIGPNPVLYDAAADSYVGTYAGQPALSTASHYRYDVSGVTQLTPGRIKIVGRGGSFANGYADRFSRTYLYSAEQDSPWTGTSSAYRSISISGPTSIMALSAIDGTVSSSSQFGGEIILIAKSGTANSSKTSTYILDVWSTGPGGGGATGVVVARQYGYLAGANATDPSFTFAIVSNALQVTPVGSASGVFNFSAQARGNVMIG